MSDFVLNDFLPYQIAVLSSRVSRDFSAAYREKYGISIPEWRVVAHLSQTDGPVSVREIFEQVEMDKSKISRAADRLVKRGLVRKSPSARDRRLVELTLSETGRDMVRDLTPTAREFEERFLAPLGDESKAFRAALETLLADQGR